MKLPLEIIWIIMKQDYNVYIILSQTCKIYMKLEYKYYKTALLLRNLKKLPINVQEKIMYKVNNNKLNEVFFGYKAVFKYKLNISVKSLNYFRIINGLYLCGDITIDYKKLNKYLI